MTTRLASVELLDAATSSLAKARDKLEATSARVQHTQKLARMQQNGVLIPHADLQAMAVRRRDEQRRELAALLKQTEHAVAEMEKEKQTLLDQLQQRRDAKQQAERERQQRAAARNNDMLEQLRSSKQRLASDLEDIERQCVAADEAVVAIDARIAQRQAAQQVPEVQAKAAEVQELRELVDDLRADMKEMTSQCKKLNNKVRSAQTASVRKRAATAESLAVKRARQGSLVRASIERHVKQRDLLQQDISARLPGDSVEQLLPTLVQETEARLQRLLTERDAAHETEKQQEAVLDECKASLAAVVRVLAASPEQGALLHRLVRRATAAPALSIDEATLQAGFVPPPKYRDTLEAAEALGILERRGRCIAVPRAPAQPVAQ